MNELTYPNKETLERGIRLVGLGSLESLVGILDSLPKGFRDVAVELDEDTIIGAIHFFKKLGRDQDVHVFSMALNLSSVEWHGTTLVLIVPYRERVWLRNKSMRDAAGWAREASRNGTLSSDEG